MSFPARIITVLCLLLCQACSHLDQQEYGEPVPVTAREFHFDDGGKALYFVLDKHAPQQVSGLPLSPDTFIFMIAGSDCASMQGMLPDYFDGLGGGPSAIRIFILHKRFITQHAPERCEPEFVQSDHPSRWITDQSEFIRTELAAAKAGGQAPRRVVILGISEGAEIAPILVQRLPAITHLALLGNGGMDPIDAYRLQAVRHGFTEAAEDIGRLCADGVAADDMFAAERTCRYWREMREIRHADNLLRVDIPVFMAMGEADDMVPIESAWFIRDKFAEVGKSSLQLLTFLDTGHDFRRHGKSVLPQVWAAFDRWLSN